LTLDFFIHPVKIHASEVRMFIVRVHDWDTDEVGFVGPFTTTEAATLWIAAQAKNDNEDVDYETCKVDAPQSKNLR